MGQVGKRDQVLNYSEKIRRLDNHGGQLFVRQSGHLGGAVDGDNDFLSGLQLGHNWQTGNLLYGAEGDISFGDSEGTWLVQGLFAYTVGKREQNRFVFGYQFKEAEFRDGGLNTEFGYNGPMAGFNFRF